MPKYNPIAPSEQPEYINWLENVSKDLNGLQEDTNIKDYFPGSEQGDVGTIKDIVGAFLATLTNKPQTIN